jgi:hypothetical protein
MNHPFENKLFVFVGHPVRCTRQAARDALDAVGGVTEDRIGMFTHYVVAFNGAKKTKAYMKAVKHDEYGHMILLNEGQFFDILEGKAQLPKKKTPPTFPGVIVFPARVTEDRADEHDRVTQYVVEKRRLKNMAKHGTPSPDGGRIKVDFRLEETLKQMMAARMDHPVILGAESPDRCDNCGKPSRVHFGDEAGGVVSKLCRDCYNRAMADMTGTDFMDGLPQRLSFKSKGGKTHSFDIELMIFANGKSLTATEIGKTKRKVDVHGDLEDDVEEMLETLKQRIKKTLSTTYIGPDGYIIKSKAVGYIEYNEDREAHDIIIDGKPFTWAELEKNISGREGWKIKIEFGDVGDEL